MTTLSSLEPTAEIRHDPFASLEMSNDTATTNLSISHARSVGDDPFAGVVQRISEPFNEVAEGLSLKEKHLDNEAPDHQPVASVPSLQL